MKASFVRMLMLLTALAALGESRACADMINFSYKWSAEPSAVIPGGTGSVTLAVKPEAMSSAELGSKTAVGIHGADVTTTSSATDIPDSFNTAFAMKLHLTDSKSGKSGNLTFAGTLDGMLTATTSSLKAEFSQPRTQTIILGNYAYTVTIDPSLVALPSPGSQAPAVINAMVTVASVPEPTSLLLGGMGLIGLATGGWYRRRQRVAASV